MAPHSAIRDNNGGVDDEKESSSGVSTIDEESVERATRQAAMEVMEDFEDYSAIRNDGRAGMVALFDPSELCLEDASSSSSNGPKIIRQGVFATYHLKCISLGDSCGRDPPFSDEMEESRERFADRSREGYFSVKFAHRDALKKSPKDALNAACAMALEAKTLMNLPKHPHICQIYGVHADGPKAGFTNPLLEGNYFTIVDEISETLKQRISAWRKNESYEEERFDDLQQLQSKITQRLEVVVDIVSALEFLGNQKLVYLFHPGKCGFDSRMKRIKLHDFGHSQESGKVPYFQFNEERDMTKRVYCAPEVLKGREVTVAADVYAVGMLLWEVLFLKPPFHGMKRDQHMKEVVKGEKRPHLNSHFPSTLKEIVTGCWASGKRLEMADIHNKLEELLLSGADLTWTSDSIVAKSKSMRPLKPHDHAQSEKDAEAEKGEKRRSNSRRKGVSKLASKRAVAKSESPRVSSPRRKKIQYEPNRGASVDGKENDKESTRSNSSKKTKGSHSSRRSATTDSCKMKSPSMRGRKPSGESGSKISKGSRPTKPSRSKSMDDSIKIALNVQPAEGKRSKSMDDSHLVVAGRKIKFEKRSVITKGSGGDSKSLASRKSSGTGISKDRCSPSKPKSSRKLSLSPQVVKEGASNFVESMKSQVASIRMNLVGEKMSPEVTKPLSEKVDRGRGVRRSMSVKRHSSRTLNSRSSSRENMIPVNKSFAVRRSLSRGLTEERNRLSSRSLVSPLEDGATPPRAGLARESSVKSNVSSSRLMQKSSSGLLETIVLGDPSRQAPARSKSSTLFGSSPHLQGTKAPASFRRKSSDDKNGFRSLVATRDSKEGYSTGPSSPRASPRSPGDLRGKLNPSLSGGLLPVSSKDGFGRIKRPAHPRSKTPDRESNVSVASPTISPSKRDLFKPKRPNSGRLNSDEKTGTTVVLLQ